MADTAATVRAQYGRDGILAAIEAALAAAGVDPARPAAADLYPFDQLHGIGIVASRAHADRANLAPGARVLDLGCGIGGSSRFLAAERGATVTGIDLTPAFVAVARTLTARCGLDVRYEVADALALPFPDAAFDHVWCHNVTMNVADKAALAAEARRVLVPGGRLSCVELVQGPGGPPAYPLPWAREPAASFLATPEAMRAALEAGGLRVLVHDDITEASFAFARAAKARAERGEPVPRPRIDVVMGEDFPARAQNAAQGMRERRLLDQFILAERPLDGPAGRR